MRPRCARRSRGYTIVELMMAIAVLSVSISGVIAMQKVTVVANTNARDIAVANHIGQAWLEQLQTDAILWNYPAEAGSSADDLADTFWLKIISPDTGYELPAWNSTVGFGPAFDGLGNPVDTSTGGNTAQVKYCVHVRLDRLYATNQPNGAFRASVRVIWRRSGTAAAPYVCNADPAALSQNAQSALYHSITHTTVIYQRTALKN